MRLPLTRVFAAAARRKNSYPFDGAMRTGLLQPSLVAPVALAVVGCEARPARTVSTPHERSHESTRCEFRYKSVAEDDPAAAAVQRWRELMLASYADNERLRVVFGPWREIDSAPLRKLFPSHRFLRVTYREVRRENTYTPHVSLNSTSAPFHKSV